MTLPHSSTARRETVARSATAWVLCSLAGLPIVLGLCVAVLTR